MRFSKRLQAICSMVSPGESIADIGTDHGYVPLALYEKGTAGRVIMCDISRGSLDKAIGNFHEHGTDMDPDDFRLADGLCGLADGEVDVVIIAGMGGSLIASLLDADISRTRSFGKFILQPRNNSGELRYFLFTHGFDITAEVLAGEGKFVCEVISAVPVSGIYSRLPMYPENDIRWKYPPTFSECDFQLLSRRLDWKLGSIDEEITNLRSAKTDSSERIAGLRSDREYLTELLERCRQRTEA